MHLLKILSINKLIYIIAKVEELYLHHPGWRGQGGAGGVCDENGSAGQMLSRLNVTSLDFTGHPPIKHSIQHSTGRLKSVKCLETSDCQILTYPADLFVIWTKPSNHLHFSTCNMSTLLTSKTNLRLLVWWFWSDPSVSFCESLSVHAMQSSNAS